MWKGQYFVWPTITCYIDVHILKEKTTITPQHQKWWWISKISCGEEINIFRKKHEVYTINIPLTMYCWLNHFIINMHTGMWDWNWKIPTVERQWCSIIHNCHMLDQLNVNTCQVDYKCWWKDECSCGHLLYFQQILQVCCTIILIGW